MIFERSYKWLSAHSRALFALACALLCCRLYFYEQCGVGVDGSWTWALNYAIHKGSVFGRDFVFTYGPLGYLHTRYLEYISAWPMLAGDILLACGTYHLVRHILPAKRRWWPLLLVALMIMRCANYSQALFTLFILFFVSAISSTKTSKATLAFCALYGVMLFFVKINYGLISVLLLLLLAVIYAFRDRKGLLLLLISSSITFCILYFSVNISLYEYVRNSIPLITNFDDAMFRTIDPKDLPYRSAMFMLTAMLIPLAMYIWAHRRTGDITTAVLPVTLVIMLACFLFYKNAFTRYDASHYDHFFASYGFFFICISLIIGQGRSITLFIVGLIVVTFSLLNFSLKDSGYDRFTADRALHILFPSTYYSELFRAIGGNISASTQFYEQSSHKAGWQSADILPHFISVMRTSEFNYAGRPVPQSYSVYSPSLDTLNAAYFIGITRPDVVLMNNDAIDGRYPMWDESVTKAAIHLNYSVASPTTTTISYREGHTTLTANKGPGQRPLFVRTGSRIVKMGEFVRVDPDTTYPIYITANIKYTFHGFLDKMIYQPMDVLVAITTLDGSQYKFRAPIPILKGPVLICNFVNSHDDLLHFMAGDLLRIQRIKGFSFITTNNGLDPNITLAFYQFRNYRLSAL